MLYVMARYCASVANRYSLIDQELLVSCIKETIYWAEYVPKKFRIGSKIYSYTAFCFVKWEVKHGQIF